MAFWTIIGTGKEGDAEGRKFGITLDTDNNTWTAGGSSVDLFFNTRRGPYLIILAPENGTRLNSDSGGEVAFFKTLTGSSSVGSTGTGRSSEKGVNFDWVLQSK